MSARLWGVRPRKADVAAGQARDSANKSHMRLTRDTKKARVRRTLKPGQDGTCCLVKQTEGISPDRAVFPANGEPGFPGWAPVGFHQASRSIMAGRAQEESGTGSPIQACSVSTGKEITHKPGDMLNDSIVHCRNGANVRFVHRKSPMARGAGSGPASRAEVSGKPGDFARGAVFATDQRDCSI